MNKKKSNKLQVWAYAFGFAVLYTTLLSVIYYVDWDEIYIFSKRPVVIKVEVKENDLIKTPKSITKAKFALRQRLEQVKRENLEAVILQQELISKLSTLDPKAWRKFSPKKYAEFTKFIDSIRNYSPAHLRLIRSKMKSTSLKLRLSAKHVTKLVELNSPKVDKQLERTKVTKVDEKVETLKTIIKPNYNATQLELIRNISATQTGKAIEKKTTEKDPAKLVNTANLHFTLLKKVKLYDSKMFTVEYLKLLKSLSIIKEQNLSSEQKRTVVSIKQQAESLKDAAGKIAYNMIGLTPVETLTVLSTELPQSFLKIVSKQQAIAESLGYPVEVKNIYGMRFRFIPAGTFTMGSPDDEVGRSGDEKLHEVTISRPFYMQMYEMSKKQLGLGRGEDKTLPVAKISWKMATEFCKKINMKENLPSDLYALPTEAMWEYACRATITKATYLADLNKIAFSDKSFSGKVEERGQKLPNGWGLFDMLGNVREICIDRCDSPLFFAKPPKSYVDRIKDPVSESGSNVVVRGGGWGSSDSQTRAAARELIHDESKEWDIGFRIVRLLL